MSLQLFVILLFTGSLINQSEQTCTIKQWRRNIPRFIPVYVKLLYCELTPLTSDFYKEVEKITKGVKIDWIEFNNTQSPEIATGAFRSLNNLTDLRLNDLSVRVIQPGAFDGLLNLEQLLLNNNQIIRLEKNCFNLSSLKVLDLSYNSVADISDKTFVYLKSLKTLNLQNNFITRLSPEIFSNLTNLEFLDLSFNKLTEFGRNHFKELKLLNKLLVNNNNLHKFTSDLSYNSLLETLFINNNYLTTLQELSLSNTSLNASHNLIQQLNFVTFSNLKVLDLSANGITSLKKEFFENLAVKELYLDQNYIGKLPKNIFSNLTTLTTLSLKNNRFKTFDSDLLIHNTKLTQLNLDGNYLVHVDFYLPFSLEHLSLSHNLLDSSLNLSSLTNLLSLDLNHNQLEKISFHFLEKLENLSVLNLNSNKISKIDIGAFHKFKILNNLDLSNNNISKLELGTFVGINLLLSLDLSHNKLDYINEGIFHNMRKLRFLNLGYNNLSFLSVENTLSHILVLREVDLSGNNWPCSVLTAAIRNFKKTIVKSGNDYNVTNVNGIRCQYEQKTPQEVMNLEKCLNNLESELSSNNSLLICILLVLIVGLTLKYARYYVKNKKFVLPKNEQEIQLL